MRFSAFKIASVILVLLGLAMVGHGVRLRYLEATSKGWVETRGEVLAFEWGHGDGGNYPAVRYRYRVDGVEYQGRRKVFGSRTRSTLRALSPGDAIPVYHHPDRPGKAVLQPREPTGWAFFVIFGLVFTTGAVYQLRWQIRAERDRP